MLSTNGLLTRVLVAVVLLFFNPAVYAEIVGKLVRPFISYGMTADDNILRIRDQMDAEALFGTSNLFDISHRFLGGAVIDKQISRQKFHITGHWSHTRFEKFSRINNNAYDLQGNWNWFLGNRFEGNLGAKFNRSQAPFLFQPAIKNIHSQHTEYFNFAWHYHPSWRLRGDYSHFNFESSNFVLRFQNRRENRFEGGLDFLASSGSSIGLQYRHIRGEFTSPVQTLDGIFTENDYNQNEVKGKIDWKLTGKSHLKFLGGWVERNNASFSASDFSGFNARMTYFWKPTSKIGITLSGWRETVAIQSLTANFSLNTGGSTTAVWQFSEKTKLQGYFSYLTQKFDRFSVLTNQTDDLGNNNKILTGSLELTYAPFYGTEISTAAVHNSLSSNSPLGGFTANGVTVSLRYILGRK
ncbi:XrtB/PEP-CTERM-associated polysaccharide biosynthesis outer membrane protein EpsL [Nitrosomonas marina]|uniref:Exopolysaccharide biosynthesis operon protein EpsL n=1 Tax=Nitrosomonas marina TaxID=917 RepID=A0A1H8HNM5_9PROT|nr:XrtB/PEP-CTERM-associated polysaccharide biosynthesis outer membrane protein EpsL [Nitrosomonas marina]SEN57693.1 exopolysaccharide biosynthesis operon protein EpsL [Nitrosomonas marina]